MHPFGTHIRRLCRRKRVLRTRGCRLLEVENTRCGPASTESGLAAVCCENAKGSWPEKTGEGCVIHDVMEVLGPTRLP
jgi:hypothetical protein